MKLGKGLLCVEHLARFCGVDLFYSEFLPKVQFYITFILFCYKGLINHFDLRKLTSSLRAIEAENTKVIDRVQPSKTEL